MVMASAHDKDRHKGVQTNGILALVAVVIGGGMMQHLGKKSVLIKSLRRRVRRRAEGEVIIDGRRLLDDVVRWDIGIVELYLAAGLAETAEAETWIDTAEQVFEVDQEVLADVAPTRNPQGVLAVTAEPRWPVWPASDGVGLYLEAVQDPGNLGAIIRSAAGLGAAAVLLGSECADPFGPAAVRGSAGSVFRIPIEREVPLGRAVERIRRHRGELWATGGNGRQLSEWQPSEPMLLMMGTEGRGLSDEALTAADGVVTIPLERGIESLNVAVAAGILLSHLSHF
jgi:TrmH family RNA methyltransferase